jgi:hypothetical protein
MRAREFTINVPITISISGDNEPVVSAGATDQSDLDQNPVMVAPLQQQLELQKAELGKSSPVIDKLTAPDQVGQELPPSDETGDLINLLKSILGR